MTPVTAVPMTKLSVYFLLSLLRDDPTVSFPLENRKHHWAYKGVQGPDHWPNSYPLCAGQNQSPIDIHTSACEYDPTLTDFSLTNFNQLSTVAGLGCQLNLTNNGHVASVAVSGDMSIEGGGLIGRYKTVEFHFHWGSTDDVGSEHAVDGAKFPLEMHVVNYAEKYETFSEAMSHPDGLAVLAVFFQVTEQDNPDFAPLAQTLQYLHKAGEHRLVDGVRLASLLPGDTSRYWRYQGSLTTPSCYQSVTWTVFRDPQKVSARQLRELRSLLHEDGHESADRQHAASGSANSYAPSYLVDNWRPLQPLNGRQVKRSFQDAPAPPTTRPAQTIAVTTYQSIREISQFPTVTTNQSQSSRESGHLVASVKPPHLTGELGTVHSTTAAFGSQTMTPSLQSSSQLFTTTFIPLRFTASLLQTSFSSPSLTTLRASSPAGSDTSGNGIYVLVRDFPQEANSTRSRSRPPLSSLDTSLDRLAELNPASVLLSGANTVQESKHAKDSQSTSSTNQLGSFDTSKLIQIGTVSESNNKLRSKFSISTVGTSASNNKLQSDFLTRTVGTSASNNKLQSDFSTRTVGTSASNNKLQSDFSTSTVGTSASNNKLQSDFSTSTVGTSASNKLQSDFSTSTVGTSASNNKLQSDFSNNTVGISASNNIQSDFSASTFGTSASNNKLQSDFSTRTVGTTASNNKLQSEFSASTFGTSASNNKLQSDFSTRRVGTTASNNKLQSDFSTRRVGTTASNNKLQSDFSTNTVGTSASNSKLQSDFSTSTVGTSASNRKLQSDFSTSTVGTSASNRKLQSDFSNNTVGISASNNIQSDFSASTFGTSASNNKLQSDFSTRTVGTTASNNKLQSEFSASTFGTSASNNKLQSDFSTRRVGTTASNNKLQSDFSTRRVGTTASNNKLQSDFSTNTVGTSASNSKLQSDFSTSTVGTSASNRKLQSDFSTSTVGTSASNRKLQSDFSTSTVGTSASNSKLQSDFSTSTAGASRSYKSEKSALFGFTYTLVPFSGSLGTSTRVQNSGRFTLPALSVTTSRPTGMTPLGGSLSPLQLVLQQLRQSGSQNTRSQSNFSFHPSLSSESSPKIIMPDGTRMSVNYLHQGPGQRQYPIFPPATGRFIQPLATQTNSILTQSSRSWNKNVAEQGLQSLRSSLYYSPSAASAGLSPMVERYSGQIYPEYSLYPVVAGNGGVDTPFVFLHGYNQPVRIRRLLYDHLYGSQHAYFNQ